MRQYIPVITLALLSALALAVVSGGLFPSDSAVHAAGSVQFTVPENTPPGTNVGAPVTASETVNTDDKTLVYSLDGSDKDSFGVDELTGQVITKAPLNYEDDNNRAFSFSVIATNAYNSDDGVDSTVVIVMVGDVEEPPPAPAAPTVTSGSNATSLEVHWDAPDNTGRPNIGYYETQYKKTTESDYSTPARASSSPTTISNVESGTSYDVSVRAVNDEGNGAWSLVGTGASNGEDNSAPSFPGGSSTRDVDVNENTPAGQNVHTAIRATDGDSTTLVYSLEGRDADSFDIMRTSGQILTKVPLDFEEKAQYTVLVKVDDGDGGSAVKPVTIDVEDLDELPSAPGMPTVVPGDDDEGTTNVDESTTILKVTWDAPDNTGPPINGQGNAVYTVEYRSGTSGSFNTANDTIDYDERSVTITNLDHDTSYQVRVKAHNGEGESPFSRTGEGKTNAGNREPEFSDDEAERNIPENGSVNANIGAAVGANDRDGDTLTYSLEGSDADVFDINESTGQIMTKSALNFEGACGDGNAGSDEEIRDANESECTYSVTVKAEDDFGSGTIPVKIMVADRDEVPSAPEKPTVTSVGDDSNTQDVDESTTQLKVSWHPPENMGPHITGYEVQYRERNRGSFTIVQDSVMEQDGTVTVTITGLTEYKLYEVRVNATSDEGTGDWTDSGLGYTNTAGNALPVFAENSPAQREIDENPSAVINVGNPVTADDGPNENDDRTYSREGADADLFTIDGSNGQIKTKSGVTYNHEDEACGYDDTASPTVCTYSVMVKAEDARGGSATIQGDHHYQ